MKKLFVMVAATLVLFGGVVSSSSAGYVYELSGIVVHEVVLNAGGYPLGEMTVPPIGELVFVNGFVPTPGGSFTEADITSFIIWNRARTEILEEYLPEQGPVEGSFSTTDITNSLPEIDLFESPHPPDEVFILHADNTFTIGNGNPELLLTDTVFAAQAGTFSEEYTGIQITGSESNIMTNVHAGDTAQFTVYAIAHGEVDIHYRFFTRAGYGEPDWGGNKWTIVQDWSASNTVSVPFNEAGIYFLACHAERAGEAWAFGDPQTGIVVEVWPVQ